MELEVEDQDYGPGGADKCILSIKICLEGKSQHDCTVISGV